MQIHKKIANQTTSVKKDTLWFTAGTICSSLSAIVLSLLVTRILGVNFAGEFAIGWAIAQLMLTVGWYNTRQYQVSDVSEKYKMNDYLSFKLVTCVAMIIGCIAYSLYLKQDLDSLYISLSLTGLMMSEVIADVFSGFFQHKERLYISGQSYIVRILGYDLLFTVVLLLTNNLLLAIIAALTFSFAVLYFWDFKIIKFLENEKLRLQFSSFFALAKSCLPLFIGSFLSMFIINIPKNAISLYMDNNIQAIYNIIFMPSSIVNMLGMFIFVPLFTMIARSWVEKRYQDFFSINKKIFLLIAALTVFVLIGGYFLGIPILSVVYGINLSEYRMELMILLFGGAMNSGIYVLSYLLTVLRKQGIIPIIYVVVTCISQSVVVLFMNAFGLEGICYVYCLSNILIVIMFYIASRYFIKKGIMIGGIDND